jgi:hypothetical protein
MYLRCGRAWEYKYVAKVETPTSPALVFGSAFHNAAEAFIADPNATLQQTWERAWGDHAQSTSIEWGLESWASLNEDGQRMINARPVRDMLLELKGAYAKAFHPEVEKQHSHRNC